MSNPYDDILNNMFEQMSAKRARQGFNANASSDYAYFQQRQQAHGFGPGEQVPQGNFQNFRQMEAERIGRVKRICQDAAKKGWRVKIEYDAKIGGCFRATFFYPKELKAITPEWPAYNKPLALEDAAIALYEWSMEQREKQAKQAPSANSQ